jgi:hypothetical protein
MDQTPENFGCESHLHFQARRMWDFGIPEVGECDEQRLKFQLPDLQDSLGANR